MPHLENFITSTFNIVNSEEVETIARLFKASKLKRGECISESGKRCSTMAFIKSGYLRMYSISDGKEVTQWISTAGTFTTDLASFFFDNPARWTIQALVESEIYTISKSDYQKISTLIPAWNRIEKHFLLGCFATMENRIHDLISMSTKERYDSFYNENKELFNILPLKYIASILGMTPETLSRIRLSYSSNIS